ncbi:DUF434 domain-containing protein [Flavobacterium arcticum]|uniref:DUF434 domain-containing protein n=1 Tax=Flavobacterium arcticum TaxID=1784713 RepID=A0A345H872_9FLAO|nr:DUF434 domain-containing protein [Flavobacterium arcticum]AXG72782.1 DUF434 domain-containing protein [Flavobacterium arcticum]KAF2510948.1 DUF434 domain-containing protein [Flavobacterium arcticum]
MEDKSPKTGKNRGKSSEDEKAFGTLKEQNKLQEGLIDMHYLLSRDYPAKSSLALVGNRYRLTKRQLLALQGMSCSESDIQNRKQKELTPPELKNKTIYLDGFNILILLETVLSGGFVFKGLDECYRDVSSVHGTYRKVNQTEEVLQLVGKTLEKLEIKKVVWVFDTPVSNSGKLKTLAYELAEKYHFSWDTYLEYNPDKFLVQGNKLICSSDAWILNECSQWFNLGAYIINNIYPESKSSNIII